MKNICTYIIFKYFEKKRKTKIYIEKHDQILCCINYQYFNNKKKIFCLTAINYVKKPS